MHSLSLPSSHSLLASSAPDSWVALVGSLLLSFSDPQSCELHYFNDSVPGSDWTRSTVPGVPGLRPGGAPNPFAFGILPIPTISSPPPLTHLALPSSLPEQAVLLRGPKPPGSLNCISHLPSPRSIKTEEFALSLHAPASLPRAPCDPPDDNGDIRCVVPLPPIPLPPVPLLLSCRSVNLA